MNEATPSLSGTLTNCPTVSSGSYDKPLTEKDELSQRKRKWELVEIAKKLIVITEKMGVKKYEFCELGRYIDMLK